MVPEASALYKSAFSAFESSLGSIEIDLDTTLSPDEFEFEPDAQAFPYLRSLVKVISPTFARELISRTFSFCTLSPRKMSGFAGD